METILYDVYVHDSLHQPNFYIGKHSLGLHQSAFHLGLLYDFFINPAFNDNVIFFIYSTATCAIKRLHQTAASTCITKWFNQFGFCSHNDFSEIQFPLALLNIFINSVSSHAPVFYSMHLSLAPGNSFIKLISIGDDLTQLSSDTRDPMPLYRRE